jgi:hypothetical protein
VATLPGYLGHDSTILASISHFQFLFSRTSFSNQVFSSFIFHFFSCQLGSLEVYLHKSIRPNVVSVGVCLTYFHPNFNNSNYLFIYICYAPCRTKAQNIFQQTSIPCQFFSRFGETGSVLIPQRQPWFSQRTDRDNTRILLPLLAVIKCRRRFNYIVFSTERNTNKIEQKCYRF